MYQKKRWSEALLLKCTQSQTAAEMPRGLSGVTLLTHILSLRPCLEFTFIAGVAVHKVFGGWDFDSLRCQKIHLPMQFSTQGAGRDGEIIQDWSLSFKVAVRARRHIWNDDRLRESDKSKVSDSRFLSQVLSLRPPPVFVFVFVFFWDPWWQAEIWDAVIRQRLCFNRL